MRVDSAIDTRSAPGERELDRLEQLLHELDQQHAHLLGLLLRKREAIAEPSASTLEELCRREREVLQRIEALEQSRLEVVSVITRCVDAERDRPMTVTEIAEVAGSESGPRLLVIAAQIKEKMRRSQKLASILKTATEALGQHLAGVMQTFQTALGQARVYGRSGRIVTGNRVRSTLDMVS